MSIGAGTGSDRAGPSSATVAVRMETVPHWGQGRDQRCRCCPLAQRLPSPQAGEGVFSKCHRGARGWDARELCPQSRWPQDGHPLPVTAPALLSVSLAHP